jgi:hypothetical protein
MQAFFMEAFLVFDGYDYDRQPWAVRFPGKPAIDFTQNNSTSAVNWDSEE